MFAAFLASLLLVGCGSTDDGGASIDGSVADGDAAMSEAGAECGPSPCGACAPPFTNSDRCVDGGWVCQCVGPDGGLTDGAVIDGGGDAGCDEASCEGSSTFQCRPVTQGEFDPDNPPPTVCGCMPSTCPPGQSLVVNAGTGTWCDDSRKGDATCSSELPP